MTPLEWLVRSDPPASGAANMAWDHTWAAWCPPGRAVLRFYGWERPTLSFGRNEPALDVYDPALVAARGWDVVRRPTGGRAVLHHRELTYAAVVPLRALGSARETYRILNEGLAAGLRTLGVEASVVPESHTAGVLPLEAGPCFAGPAPGELVARGRKLVGSAQVRIGRVLLQHGSLLLQNQQELVSDVRSSGTAVGEDGGSAPVAASAGVTALDELMDGVPERNALEGALMEGLRGALGSRWIESDWAADTAIPRSPAREFTGIYGSRDWTWRR